MSTQNQSPELGLRRGRAHAPGQGAVEAGWQGRTPLGYHWVSVGGGDGALPRCPQGCRARPEVPTKVGCRVRVPGLVGWPSRCSQ